jgi:hypothetical protein
MRYVLFVVLAAVLLPWGSFGLNKAEASYSINWVNEENAVEVAQTYFPERYHAEGLHTVKLEDLLGYSNLELGEANLLRTLQVQEASGAKLTLVADTTELKAFDVLFIAATFTPSEGFVWQYHTIVYSDGWLSEMYQYAIYQPRTYGDERPEDAYFQGGVVIAPPNDWYWVNTNIDGGLLLDQLKLRYIREDVFTFSVIFMVERQLGFPISEADTTLNGYFNIHPDLECFLSRSETDVNVIEPEFRYMLPICELAS